MCCGAVAGERPAAAAIECGIDRYLSPARRSAANPLLRRGMVELTDRPRRQTVSWAMLRNPHTARAVSTSLSSFALDFSLLLTCIQFRYLKSFTYLFLRLINILGSLFYGK